MTNEKARARSSKFVDHQGVFYTASAAHPNHRYVLRPKDYLDAGKPGKHNKHSLVWSWFSYIPGFRPIPNDNNWTSQTSTCLINMASTSWPSSGSALDETTASNVDLNAVLENDFVRDVVCFLNDAGNEYDGSIGVRVSALFVVLIVSSAVTFFPVIATRSKRVRIPLYVYLFARYFGAGVIIATAFIQ